MGTVFNKEEMLVLLQDFHRLTGLRTAARKRREAFPGNPDENRCSDNG